MKKILPFFLLLCGCSVSWSNPKSTANIAQKATVCINVPVEYQSDAALAVSMWDRSLSSWRRFQSVFNTTESCSYIIKETTETNSNSLAWTNHIGGNEILLTKGRYENNVFAIVLHEFGHALGAQHVPNTIMAKTVVPKVQTTPCPDIVTVAQIAAYNKLNLETLSWCYY